MFPGASNQGQLTDVCGSLPLVFMFIMSFQVISFILDKLLLGSLIIGALADITQLTVYSFQIWRVLAGFLVANSLLNLIFSMLAFYFSAVPYEKRYSTTLMLLDVFMQNIIFETFICLVSVLLDLVGFRMLVSFGLWNLWMIHICRFCLEDPDGQLRIPCFPCTVKKRYYPFVICGLFSIMSLDPVMILALVFGYIQAYYFKGYFITIRLSWLRKIEACLPRKVTQWSNYISISKCSDLSNITKLGFGEAALSQEAVNPSNPARMGPGTFFSTGVAVGGNQVTTAEQMRNHWANHDENEMNPDLLDTNPSTILSDKGLIQNSPRK